MKIQQVIRQLVQLVAFAVFTYQMVLAFGKYITFRTTAVKEIKDIKDGILPSIFVCPKAFDVDDRFKKQGYKNGSSTFLSGILDDRVLSWQGNQNLTYENMTKLMFSVVKTQVLGIEGNPRNNWNLEKKLKYHMFALNGLCKQIDLNTTNVPSSEMFYVWLLLLTQETSAEMRMNIIITHPASSLYYKINPESLKGTSPFGDQDSRQFYSLSLEEVYTLEESGECTKYGETAKFMTYADCVADEYKRIFMPIIGCTIPWTTAVDDEDACKDRVTVDEDTFNLYLQNYHKLLNRIYMSSILQHSTACLKPCFEVKIKSKWLMADEGMRGIRVMLNFEKIVKVTRYMKAYGLFDLVVEVGSCLGLWIGLSAMGVLDLVLDTAFWLRTQIKKQD